MINQWNPKEELVALAETDYQAFTSKLLPGISNILGVRLPKIRIIAKRIAKEGWREYLDQNDLNRTSMEELTLEEILLYGMVIGNVKVELEELFPYIRIYVSHINNWSTCDTFCNGLKVTKREPEKMWLFIQNYLKSDQEYDIRFGIVMILVHYITEDYIDQLFPIFNSIHHEGYYVKMAVAWAVSMCFVKYPEKTFEYMESSNNTLDDFTYNKALQKGRESYCISPEDKELMKQMKRKTLA